MTKKDLDPVYYSKNSSIQFNHAQKILEKCFFQGDEKILDIGCGDGKITAQISTFLNKGEILGIDSSKTMIAYAKKTYFSQEFPHLSFKHLSAENVTATNQFELIFSFSSFLWFNDPKLALENMRRALKHKGKAYILTYASDSRFAFVLFSTMNLLKWKKYTKLLLQKTRLKISDHEALFHHSSFHVDAFSSEEIVHKYTSAEALKMYIRGWFGSFISLSDEMREVFLSDLIEQLKKNNLCDPNENKIIAPHIKVYAALTKQ